MTDERLPANEYPPEMGEYPNTTNDDMQCMNCGVREGEPHNDPVGWCKNGVPHVSYMRHAFEVGYRRAKRFNELFWERFLAKL